MWPNEQFPADLVTFTEEILNGKLYIFLQCRRNLQQDVNKAGSDCNRVPEL